MRRLVSGSVQAYLVAIVAVLIALLARWPLWVMLGDNLPYMTFFPAVMVAAYCGGFTPGLLATALSAVGVGSFLLDYHGPSGTPVADVIGLAMFLLIGAFISGLCEAQLRTAAEAASEAIRAHEAEGRLRALAESMPHLVWTCRPDGYCDYLSRQWCDYTGVPEAEQHGSAWLAAIHPDDRSRLQERWQQAVESGSDFDIDFRIRARSGEYRWFKTRATPVRDPQGNLLRWVGSNTDIEDQVRAEASVRELNEALEARVAERTAALTEANAVLRSEIHQREQAERRARAQYVTARALAESGTLPEALAAILRSIRETLGWEMGEFWTIDARNGVLRLLECSHSNHAELAAFAAKGRQLAFRRGEGMAGQVWESGQPMWIEDLAAANSVFVDAESALQVGLRCGLAFPVVSGGRVLGVFDFLWSESTPHDARTLALVAGLGNQLGQEFPLIQKTAKKGGFHGAFSRWRMMNRCVFSW